MRRPSGASSSGGMEMREFCTLNCAEVFRIMAFAQLTLAQRVTARYPEDPHGGQIQGQAVSYGSGGRRRRVRRWPDALNHAADWRIYHDLAQRLIARARQLYASFQSTELLDLDATVYALDSTTTSTSA